MTCHDNRAVTKLLIDLEDERLFSFPGNPFMQPYSAEEGLSMFSNYGEYGNADALWWLHENYPHHMAKDFKVINPIGCAAAGLDLTRALNVRALSLTRARSNQKNNPLQWATRRLS